MAQVMMAVLHWVWRKVGGYERYLMRWLCESETQRRDLAVETKLGLTGLRKVWVRQTQRIREEQIAESLIQSARDAGFQECGEAEDPVILFFSENYPQYQWVNHP